MWMLKVARRWKGRTCNYMHVKMDGQWPLHGRIVPYSLEKLLKKILKQDDRQRSETRSKHKKVQTNVYLF